MLCISTMTFLLQLFSIMSQGRFWSPLTPRYHISFLSGKKNQVIVVYVASHGLTETECSNSNMSIFQEWCMEKAATCFLFFSSFRCFQISTVGDNKIMFWLWNSAKKPEFILQCSLLSTHDTIPEAHPLKGAKIPIMWILLYNESAM